MFLASTGCFRDSGLPSPESLKYREFTSAFYVGLAGLETGEDMRAQEKLTLASRLVPGEAATWANLALFSARQQDFDSAFKDAEKARDLASRDSRIEGLLGAIEAKRGRLPESIADFQKAVDLDRTNLKALYGLAEQTEREGGASSDADAQALYAKALASHSDNLALLLDLTRLAAKRGDKQTMQSGISRLTAASNIWPGEARQRLAILQQSAKASSPQASAVQVTFLRNVLARVPSYRQSLNAVKTPATFVAEPFRRFLNLPNIDSTSAPADTDLRFTAQALPGVTGTYVMWAGAMPLDASGKQYVITADLNSVHIAGGATLSRPAGTLGRNGVLGADLNYDFKTDLVLASAGGVRIYQQQTPADFVDFTSRAKLPNDVLTSTYSGAWAFDIDLDGDLDILLGRPGKDSVVLRNNADNTFAVLHPFPGVEGLVSFAAADIDGDGDPDVAMVDEKGGLHVYSNERLGSYRARPLPSNVNGRFVAVAAGDVNGDGMPDFVALRDDGSVVRLSDRDYGSGWDVAELIKPGGKRLTQSSANLILADFDNNGTLDILAGDGRLFLGDERGWTPVTFQPGTTLTGAVDLGNSGHLDLIGFSDQPVELISRGKKQYNWQTLNVRAAKATGDQRINSFGIGGEVEIRSGLLTQKQVIASPVLHFGLGEHKNTDVARIVWPNGSVQAEFELKADQSVFAEQRLKGSCPFLFAWDGKQISFVKDGQPWSPALGLHVNAQAVAGISQTEEWFKIPGEALAPHDGYYDLRVTGELWETYYIDHYSLLAVDHPSDTEIYTDERFSDPPPALRTYTVSKSKPFRSAKDDRANDVSAAVLTVDRKYLDTFGRGRYQGVTRDHWVELELPDSATRTGPLYLIGTGWMHPTDGTVNIALGQSSDPKPRGLSIEVPDAHGHWVEVRSGLGFLAGRMKTAVIDISDIFLPNAPRKLRLRTNLEIYWDRLAWAEGRPDAETRTRNSPLTKAELHYRGFSHIDVADASSPEIPDYNRIAGTTQRWRDLEGYYTRYGDVRELLSKIDNRIVITNAGDELLLRFAELPGPQSGWSRDYVIIGSGWIKDGDYNSVFSKTVLPLPFHGMRDYTSMPSSLEKDPAYLLHPQDWETFHTRYITPQGFIRALWN